MTTPRPITDMERRGAQALANCTFLPGSPPKRFAHQMQHAEVLTERQAGWLRRLCWMYRRQITDRDVVEWGRTAPPGKLPTPTTAL